MMLGRQYIVAGICVAVGLLLVGISFFVVKHVQAQGVIIAAEQLRQCAQEGNGISCAREPIRKLLRSKSGEDIMQMLSVDLPPTQCHSFGHIVGQELYHQYVNIETALAECSQACFLACVHGAIGQAFVEEAGVDDSVDPEHLGVEEIKTIGKKTFFQNRFDDRVYGVGN